MSERRSMTNAELLELQSLLTETITLNRQAIVALTEAVAEVEERVKRLEARAEPGQPEPTPDRTMH